MPPPKLNPCRDGLTPECFEQFPQWAKQAFFYRLLHLLLPAQVTSKLPAIFRNTLFFPGAQFPPDWAPGDTPPEGATIPPGVVFPPGWQLGDPWPSGVLIWDPFTAPAWLILPDGTVVLPGAIIPEGWTPGDPLPDGITLAPGASFPPGWQPGDPLPEGITVDPGAAFPPGWTSGDPLPEGFLEGLGIPAAALDTGTIPPLFDLAFIGGGGSWLTGAAGAAGAYIFSDTFETIDLNEWTITISVNGTIDIVSAQLRMQKTLDAGLIYYLRSDPDIPGTRYNFGFMLRFISGASRFQFEIWDGTYRVQIRFLLPSTLEIYDGSSWQGVTLSDFTDVEHTYQFNINLGLMDVYQDGNLKATALGLETFITPAGTHRFILNDTGNVRVANFRLTGI